MHLILHTQFKVLYRVSLEDSLLSMALPVLNNDDDDDDENEISHAGSNGLTTLALLHQKYLIKLTVVNYSKVVVTWKHSS